MAIELLRPSKEIDEVEVLTDAERGDTYVPEGFEDVAEFLQEAMDEFDMDAVFDQHNREAALDDLLFTSGDQWDSKVLKERQDQGRPCLTINTLPQFIGQVIGERIQNSSSIRVLPKHDGTKKAAEIRADLIRSIEVHSRAVDVYDKACENQITCGIANMRVDLDFTDDDVFDQDIFIKSINNPLAVIWDRMSVDKTGSDANHCFVIDLMTDAAFEDAFPGELPVESFGGTDFQHRLLTRGWRGHDFVRVVEYWRMIEVERELALFTDGSIRDVTDLEPSEFPPGLVFDKDGPRMRKVMTKIAQMHLITGFAILEGPYETPLPRLPIVKVTGREVELNDERVRFGLVRFAKDPQRLKNYWRSVAAETLALAPKAGWIAPSHSIEGREADFREAARSGDTLLIYNKNTPEPKPITPPPVSQGVLFEAEQNTQDMKDVTGIHDASLGLKSNEVSGRAINARAQRGAIATIMYHKNLNASIQEVGRIVNAYIPLVYDAPRTVRVVGINEEDRLIRINDEFDPESIDIAKGRYDVLVTTGPNFATKREEASAAMLNAVNAFPQIMEIAGDLIFLAQDWPMAEQLADRFKKALPPGLQEEEETDDPAAQQNANDVQRLAIEAKASELAQLQTEAALELEQKTIDLQRAKAEAIEANAKARKAVADAVKAEADAETAGIDVGANIARVMNELSQATEEAIAPKQPAVPATPSVPTGGGVPNALAIR